MNASRGRGYFRKNLMANGIILFYRRHGLFPQGLHAGLPCVEDWASKSGLALARLVTFFRFWQKHAETFSSNVRCFFFTWWIVRAATDAKAARFRPLAKRSHTSKKKQLQWIRDNLHDIEPWLLIR